MVGVALHERPAERVEQHDRDALTREHERVAVVLAGERGDPRRELGEPGHPRWRTSNISHPSGLVQGPWGMPGGRQA